MIRHIVMWRVRGGTPAERLAVKPRENELRRIAGQDSRNESP